MNVKLRKLVVMVEETCKKMGRETATAEVWGEDGLR